MGNSWVNLSDNTYLRAKIFSLEVGPGGELLGEPADPRLAGSHVNVHHHWAISSLQYKETQLNLGHLKKKKIPVTALPLCYEVPAWRVRPDS